jgi:hypothetical protein
VKQKVTRPLTASPAPAPKASGSHIVVKREPSPEPVVPPPAPEAPSTLTPSPSYPWSVSEPAEYYVWSLDLEQYTEEGPVIAQIVRRPEDSEFKTHIALLTPDGKSLRILHVVSSDMNQRFSQKMCSFTWNYRDEQGGINSFCIRFHDEESLGRFLAAYMRAGWEALHQMSFDKAKAQEQSYVMSSNTEDVEMADVQDDDDDDEDDVLQELDPDNGMLDGVENNVQFMLTCHYRAKR